jgi:Fe-S-cluster containining protein
MKAFECKMCGTCCHGEGGIFLEPEEVERMADFLGITPGAFRSLHCETRNGRISAKTGPEGYCIFYDRKKQCLVHPVKPRSCSQWPFYPALLKDEETWEMAKNACPGLNPDATYQDFLRQSKETEEK